MFSFQFVAGKNIYISNSGNDSFTGLSEAQAWKTIAKLNASMATVVAGDFILFEKGGTWNEGIVMAKSGTISSPITISSYGTGAKPILNGLYTVPSWTLVTPGIYQSTVGANNRLNMVTLNGIPQAVGRFPNIDAANGGYLLYTAFTGNTSVTAAGLAVNNWIGAEILIRKEGYILEKDIITSQSSGTVNYRRTQTINPRNELAPQPVIPNGVGNGLFVQRHPATLDRFSEWYFDTVTRKLKMYFGANNPASFTVKASVLDTLININTRQFIIVDGLDLQGANLAAVFFNDGSTITVKNCNMEYNGIKGVFGWNTPNVLVDNNTFRYSMCSAIDIVARIQDGLTVTNNTATNGGQLPGMSSYYNDGDAKQIYLTVRSNMLVRKNRVDTSGYVGIQFQGANVTIDSNYVNWFCFVKDDGGAIYTYADTNKANRVIKNNIVRNGIGAPVANINPPHAEGIYTDGESANVDIYDNSISDICNRGLYNNDPKNVSVFRNTVYNSFGWGVNKHWDGDIRDYYFHNNILFYGPKPSGNEQTYANTGITGNSEPLASNIQQALQRFGLADTNYYWLPIDNVFMWYYVQNPGEVNYTFVKNVPFAYWKTYTLHDLNSILWPANTISNYYYNDTDTTRRISFTGYKKLDPRGVSYSDFCDIPAWQSVVLIPDGNSTPNLPPIVNAGATQVITLPTSSVTLTGTASDPDGTISSVLWTKLASSPSGGAIASPTTLSTGVSALIAGSYLFKLTATDNNGVSTSDTVEVYVNPAPPNTPPTANAGVDKVITLPINSVTLNGSGTDSDGTITGYAWIKLAGSPSGGTIGSPSSATTLISAMIAGTYQYQLTVTDNSGNTAKDTVRVIVNPAPIPNAPPTANAGSDKAITLPTSTTSFAGSGADSDGFIVSYGWVKLSGPTGGTIDNPTSAATGISSLQEGTYQYQLTVYDDDGAFGSDVVQVIVSPAVPPVNIPPTANAGSNQTITLPTNSVTLTGSGTDTDGTIVSYAWVQLSGSTSNIVSPTSASTVVNGYTAAGSYSYQLTVTDNNGATGTSIVSVTVNPVPNTPPISIPGANQSVTLPTSTVALDGSNSTDLDGTIVSYAWTKVSGPSGGAISTPTTATTNITGLIAGVYVYRLTVTDNSGTNGSNTVQITVYSEPLPGQQFKIKMKH